MSIKSRAFLAAPLLLLLATGYTSCESFVTVTVPATDTRSPTTYDGVWKDGEYVEGAIPGQNIDYHITPGEAVLAIGSAVDPGGLRRLTMSSSFRYTCCSSSNVCSVTQPISVPQTDTQSGGVGSSVSNGIWLYSAVELPSCSSGMTLRSYSFSWFTQGEDFHGNITRGSSHRIVYP
jgi:hypothetical protein